jgi:hypothetical protein
MNTSYQNLVLNLFIQGLTLGVVFEPEDVKDLQRLHDLEAELPAEKVARAKDAVLGFWESWGNPPAHEVDVQDLLNQIQAAQERKLHEGECFPLDIEQTVALYFTGLLCLDPAPPDPSRSGHSNTAPRWSLRCGSIVPIQSRLLDQIRNLRLAHNLTATVQAEEV